MGPDPSIAIAAMLFIALFAVLKAKNRARIDHGIACVLGLVSVVLVLRPVMVALVEGAPSGDGAISESLWVVSIKLAALFSWISFAILFLVRIAADLMEDLAEQSVTDALSGVLNRRGFFERAAPILERASAALPVTVLVCGIDRFKKINDTYGHKVGDAVIKGLGKVLREAASQFGIVGRLGGEEFAVVLPATETRAAVLFAETIRTAFSHDRHEGLPSSHQPSVSIGLAEARGGENLDSILERADTALYRAKRGGRDRVECCVISARPDQRPETYIPEPPPHLVVLAATSRS